MSSKFLILTYADMLSNKIACHNCNKNLTAIPQFLIKKVINLNYLLSCLNISLKSQIILCVVAWELTK